MYKLLKFLLTNYSILNVFFYKYFEIFKTSKTDKLKIYAKRHISFKFNVLFFDICNMFHKLHLYFLHIKFNKILNYILFRLLLQTADSEVGKSIKIRFLYFADYYIFFKTGTHS